MTASVGAIAAALRSGEPAVLLVGGSACREPALALARSDRRRDGRQAACARRSRRGIERGRRARRRRAHRVPRRVRGDAARRRAPPRDRRRQGAGVVLRVPREGELARARRLRGPHARRARRRRAGGPRRAGRRARRDARLGRAPTARPARAAHRSRSPRRRSAPHSARCSPKARSCPTRATRPGLFAAGATAGAPPHDWLTLTGGAIGQGLPVAVGAAVACPDRRVVALESDGSAMYTMQAWWTMAREGLDVTTILCNNSSYAVLNMELGRVGVEGSRAARQGRCSTSAAPTSTSSRWRAAWASPRHARPPPRSSTSSSPARSPLRGRHSWKRSCPRSFEAWQDAAMTTTRMEVQRTIATDPATIFRVLCDPKGHVAIDSSGMLQDSTGDARRPRSVTTSSCTWIGRRSTTTRWAATT